jgi:hypothetical protein
MRRIVIEAADVLTVLKREKRPRGSADTESANGDPSEQPPLDVLPEELAKLEDTVVPDDGIPPESPARPVD